MDKTNFYDQMDVDIDYLFDNRKNKKATHFSCHLIRLVNKYTTAILLRTGLYEPFIEAGFISGWFKEFKEYWSKVLNGRPIYLHDFYFLLGIYRQKYQKIEVQTNANKGAYLKSWQHKDTLYQLFGAVRRYAYAPLHCYKLEKWIEHGDAILEYGCGIAPVSNYLMKYSTKRKLNITIADIRQINSHFARWRIGEIAHFIEIQPYDNNLPNEYFNVIFMITVMEHLPDPMNTIVNVTNSLKRSGILVFDYIFGEGEGLDTLEAVQQRCEVLEYINKHYDLLSGKISKETSMGTTVCRRK